MFWRRSKIEERLREAINHFRIKRIEISLFATRILYGDDNEWTRIPPRYVFWKSEGSMFRCDTCHRDVQMWNTAVGRWESVLCEASDDPMWSVEFPGGTHVK